MITIYGSSISPFVRKVLMVLELKNISYQLHTLNPYAPEHKQQLLALNPLGKVPVYQDDEITLADSSVISAYLEKCYPLPAIYPQEAKSYAKSLWYEEYIDSQVLTTIITIFLNQMLLPKMKKQPNVQAMQEALVRLPAVLNYLEQELNTKDFFVANQLTIADISMASALVSLEFIKYDLVNSSLINLSRYLTNVLSQSGISNVAIKAKEIFDQHFS